MKSDQECRSRTGRRETKAEAGVRHKGPRTWPDVGQMGSSQGQANRRRSRLDGIRQIDRERAQNSLRKKRPVRNRSKAVPGPVLRAIKSIQKARKSLQNWSRDLPWRSWSPKDVPGHSRGRLGALPGPARGGQDRPCGDDSRIENRSKKSTRAKNAHAGSFF